MMIGNLIHVGQGLCMAVGWRSCRRDGVRRQGRGISVLATRPGPLRYKTSYNDFSTQGAILAIEARTRELSGG